MASETRPDRRRAMRRQRDLAKLGMLGTMGVLVATGMQRGRLPRRLHLYAGVALLAFSYWHTRLYPTGNRERDRP